MPLVEIKFRIGTRQEDTNLWVGWCPSIDVASVGQTQGAAREAVKEAVGLWLDACGQMGTLHEALREVGFMVSTQDAISHEDRKLDSITIESYSYIRIADYLPEHVDCEGGSSDFSDFAYQHFLEAPA